MEPAVSFEFDWLEAAARIAALCDALRDIPAPLAPCSQAKVQAVKEQIYYGWEKPQAGELIAGKYERDGVVKPPQNWFSRIVSWRAAGSSPATMCVQLTA